ncbi:MAG: 4Fe-4S dicluster domain-containing protein [Clostridia bacterium]|nr:4Fe-4S dicluster domain-containing protein [Clostridia bacterium]
MSVYGIYFSPTGSTEKIVKLIAGKFGDYEAVDLSRRDSEEKINFSEEDVCIVGVPSYGGRVPGAALERMKSFKGNQAKAVLTAVYGNRAYEDTLIELEDYLVERNFCCTAAIAAVAEHSIMHQFAAGRPDAKDKKELALYGEKIFHKIKDGQGCENIELPGKRPYKEYKGVPLKPSVKKQCTKCGACVQLCPVGAIPEAAPDTVDKDKCISCMRCIAVCPNKARVVNRVKLNVASMAMKKNCSNRKENELFL